MRTIQRSEFYTDKGQYAVMTRVKVFDSAHLARIADHLRCNAEGLVFSTNPPAIDNCRIAGAVLGWAFSLAPVRIEAKTQTGPIDSIVSGPVGTGIEERSI